MRIVRLNEQTKDGLMRNLLKRSPDSYGEYEETVNGIIKEIREKETRLFLGIRKSLTDARLRRKLSG